MKKDFVMYDPDRFIEIKIQSDRADSVQDIGDTAKNLPSFRRLEYRGPITKQTPYFSITITVTNSQDAFLLSLKYADLIKSMTYNP